MKKKLFCVFIPTLLVLSSCNTNIASKNTFNFKEDTTAHEEVFGYPYEKNPLREYNTPDASTPALGIQTQTKTVDGTNYISVRFVAAINIASEDLDSTKVAWHRAMFNNDGGVYASYTEKECHTAYTSLTDGQSTLNINEFADGAYTYFFVYSILDIPVNDYYNYRLNAYLEVDGVKSKEISTTVDQSFQFTFNPESTGYFLSGIVNGVNQDYHQDNPTYGGAVATFTTNFKEEDSFVLIEKTNNKFYVWPTTYLKGSSLLFSAERGKIICNDPGEYRLSVTTATYDTGIHISDKRGSLSNTYVKGTAIGDATMFVNAEPDSPYRLLNELYNNDAAIIKNAYLGVGDFVVGSAGNNTYYRGWTNLLSEDQDTGYFEATGDSNYIHCKEAGYYDIYFKDDGAPASNTGTISIKKSQLEATNEEIDEVLIYENINASTVRVIGLQEGYLNTSSITIPSTHNGKTVVEIGDNAFKGTVFDMNMSLKTVIMPDTIKVIGEAAFKGCVVLESVTLSNTLETIKKDAFNMAGAFSGNGVSFGTLPASLTDIDLSAFEHAVTNGYDVDVNNAKYFSRNGMLLAYKLTNAGTEYNNALLFSPMRRSGNMVIDDDIELIEKCGISSLYATSITFGNGLKKCVAQSFMMCASCESYNVDTDNQLFSSTDGVLYNKDGTILLAYPRKKTGESFAVRESATSIDDYAFYGNDSLQTVNLNNVNDIGPSAFEMCINLVTVDLANVNRIANSAFKSCAKYGGDTNKKVIFADGMTSIPVDCFKGCKEIKEVILPSSVQIIRESAFQECSKLETFNFSEDLVTIESHAFKDCSSLNHLVFDPDTEDFTTIEEEAFINISGGEVVIPNSVTSIGQKAFYNTNITSITFPMGINEIKSKTCMNCYDLVSVHIPGNVKIIREKAFALGNDLTYGKLDNLYIGDGVERIEQLAFSAQYLHSVFIPKTVTYIGIYAFAVHNGSLLTANNLEVSTDYHNETGYTSFIPSGWHQSFIGSSVSYALYCDRTRQ